MKIRGFLVSDQNNRLSFAVVIFLLLSIPLYATDWYVYKNASGSNNGTSWANAWKSFSVINWSVINPGDFIYISGGTDSLVYNAPLAPECSGNSVNWITIIAGKYATSHSGHSGRVIIDGNNHTQSAIAFGDGSGSDPSYIMIKGLETRNVYSGVYANFNNFHRGFKIDSCMIYGFYGAGIKIETGEVGYQDMDSVFIENCRIVSPNYIGGESDGIQVKGASRVFINNNYIRIANQDPVQHVDAIQGYLGNGFVITNNILINDSVNSVEGGGIPIILGSEGTLPVIIYNNFCYMGGVWYSGGNWAGTLMTRWYDHNPMPPTWILNNTVVSNGPRVRGIWLEYATPTTTTVINNIIAQYSTTTSGVLDNFDNSTGSNLRVDSIRNNLFYHSWEGDVGFAGNVTGNGSTGQPSGWSDWVNNYGGTGVKGDPLLVSSIGYEPDQGLLNGKLKSGSPAINQGEDIEWLLNHLNTTYGLNGRLVWEDIYGNPRDNTPTIGAYEYDAGPDLTPPRVTGVTLSDSVTLVVNFSETLNQATAENESNYSITNNINVLNASLSGSKVTLQTSPHSSGSYVVTVVNVEDVAGNSVDPAHNTAQYEYIVLPPDTLMRFPIVDVEGIIIEPNHTPAKTIDGLGALSGDPDSRWAAEPMPEELTFDLGANRTVCKTRLSFYNWNAGRVYDYSVSISNDNNNWISIVPQATSVSNEEWTVEEFSPVNARYVRVHFLNNNQSTWAGLWEAEIWGTSTTEIDPENNNLPSGFVLSQNYPNPFNPSTIISYSIPSASFVTLKIYDILGNEVATLINEEKTNGSYEVKFSTSGGSSSGSEVYNLPSGIYFYRLQAGSFVETKKMILLK